MISLFNDEETPENRRAKVEEYLKSKYSDKLGFSQNPTAVESASPKPPESTLDQYEKAANDTSEVDAAKADQSRAQQAGMFGSALASLVTANSRARGGSDVDQSYFNKVGSLHDQDVVNAKDALKSRLESILVKDKLKFQDEERAQQRKSWTASSELADPRSAKSMLKRELAKKALAAAGRGQDVAGITDDMAGGDVDSYVDSILKGAKHSLDARKGEADISLTKAQADKARADATTTRAPMPKEPNREQFDAAGYVRRMEQAEDVFSNLEKNGFKRNSVGAGVSASLPGIMQSNDVKQQEQAERNFVNAVLRRESGAAISPSEFDNASKQYFPRAGDNEEVIKQKRANRLQVMESLKSASGNAYNKVADVNGTQVTAPLKPIHGKDLP